MKSFAFDRWDGGRITINRDFAPLFERHGLTTVDRVMDHQATVEKGVRRDRITSQFLLDGERFYIKRHYRSHVREYVKPLLRLTWPVLGAQPEWDALVAFHDVGLPTMTPVAVGKSGSRSFLITASLEDCTKLSHLQSSGPTLARGHRPLLERVAELTRTMHAAGLHHQDYYLGHFMLPKGDPAETPYIIDLGRVRRHRRLSSRWVVKDLAQLNYSAKTATRLERLRFLRRYLGRPLTPGDRPLLVRVAAKTAAIARHSRKNSL